MSFWINFGFGEKDRPVSRKKFKALEKEMSVLSNVAETLTTAVANLEARVQELVPTQAELDAIAPAPVEPPAPEPTPEPTT